MSCCISPSESPKIHRRQVELDECLITTAEDVSEDTGTYLQHISDRELPDGACFPSLFSIFVEAVCPALHVSPWVFASRRAGSGGEPVRPPQSQHPVPQQVPDGRSVHLCQRSHFIHVPLKFSLTFSPRSSTREKEKQLLEPREPFRCLIKSQKEQTFHSGFHLK